MATTPTVRSVSQASNSGGSLAVAKPAGLIAGDYLVAWHYADNDGVLSSMGAPSGWTLLGSNAGTSGADPYVKVWTKVATSTDTSASTFTFTDTAASIFNSVAILAVTAGTFDSANPVAATVAFQAGSASTSHVAPSVTGVASGLLCTSHGSDTGGTTASYTPPSGMTERADTASSWTVLEVNTLALTAASATGTKTATCTTSRPWKGSALVIAPAPTGGGGGGGGTPPTGGTVFPYGGFPDTQAYPSIPLGSTTVNVSTSAQLTTALANAVAGQRIVLGSGTYSGSFTISGKSGTTTAGISVEAGTAGGAVFGSGSTFVVTGCSYVTLSGLSFPYELSSGNVVAFRGTSNRCRVTRCLFGPATLGTAGTTRSTFVYMGDDVEYIRVDHNDIRNKTQPGNAVLGDGNFTSFQVVRHIRIDHNTFVGIKPEVANEKEPIRLGVSTMSKTTSSSVIERNFFTDCIAEPEIVSVKCGAVRVSGNTFLRCIGGPVYRHGTGGVMSDNYVVDRANTFGSTIGSGGFRFYDANHEISYNYVDSVRGGNFQGPLLLDSGDAEGAATDLAAHWRVVSALVERNVIVGGPEGVRFGNNYSLAPTDCTVRDNQVVGAASGTAVTSLVAPVNTTQTANTFFASTSAAGMTQDALSIWRKTGYGPRLTYLQQGDVGVAGDTSDQDGTGVLQSVGPSTGNLYPVDTLFPADTLYPDQVATSGTVSPTGIASAQAFGFPVITGGQVGPPANSSPTLLGSSNAILGTASLGYTTASGPPPDPQPSGSQTVTGLGNIASRQAFGVPVFSVADGPQTVVGIAIDSAEAFGNPTVSGATPPISAPGGVLVPALYAVALDGTSLTPLPAWTKITVSPVRNSPGTITVEYPAGAPGFTALHDGVSAYPLRAQQIRVWLGGNATGALGGWLVSKAGDDLTPGSSWTFSGHFQEWLLSKALVWPQARSTANPKGELRFAGATAGLILGTLMDQAKARGALPYVARDFSSTKDSNGKSWAQQVSSLNLAPKTTIAQVADKLVDLGLCEYEMTAAGVWRAYNPGTRGTDRSVGSSPLTFAHAQNLSEHARRESAKDAGTAVLAAGGEGFYADVSSATAQAQLGWRAEVAVDAGQVSSQSGVQAAAATQLEIVRNGIAEYTGAISFTPGSPLPLIDYGVGDWAIVSVNDRRARLRIAQIGLEFAAGAPPRGTVGLNDLIADKLTALYRRFNAITSGDAVVGTSTPTPGGEGDDWNPPAAPAGLTVASNIAYRVPGETTTLARVRVGWAAVTTSAYPDNDTARKALAAELISARLRSGENIFADWTWSSAPTVVGDYNDILLQDWQNAGSPAPAADWLDSWVLGVRGGPITDDIANYRVQYAYLGGTVLSGGTSAVSQITDWQEPLGSPTTGLSLDFGNIEAARAVGVRVAAIDRAGNQGPWSEILAFNSAVDDQPPPRPSKPIVSVWFETMDIFWDGRGSAGEDMFIAAPDFAGVGGGLEVHVATGIDFIPDRPVGPDGKFNPAASSTYKATLYTSGTWNVTDLAIGTTYFARFVAVDATGNASEPSETSDGALPQQLVQIDIGPNAIGRQQVIDGEIVNAKIANLAVNDAKISDLQVGKLTAGTMLANVVIGGRFSTPVANNNHIELDSAGLRLFQGNTVVGRWSVFDASMLMTGTYSSGLQGERINILPDGTLRFYQTAGVDYSEMANNGAEVLWRGPVASPTTTRHGYVSVSAARVYIGYGTRGALTMSHIACQEQNVEIRSPVVGLRVERRFGAFPLPNSNPYHRAVVIQQDSSGNEYPSYIHFYQNGEEGKPGQSTEQQILWDTSGYGLVGSANVGGLYVSRFDNTASSISASAFLNSSSIERKARVRAVADDDDQLFGAYAVAPAKRWRYKKPGDPVNDADPHGPKVPQIDPPPVQRRMRNTAVPDGEWDALPHDHPDKWTYRELARPERWEPEHLFPVAEDLEMAHPNLVTISPGGEKMVDLRDFSGFMWETLRRLIPRLQELEGRVAAVERPPSPQRRTKEPPSA